jgi:hypothetical protein
VGGHVFPDHFDWRLHYHFCDKNCLRSRTACKRGLGMKALLGASQWEVS